MGDKVYVLAKLNDSQLELLRKAERSLGPVDMVAFQPIQSKVVSLNPTQIECLEGLEKSLGLTVIAYQKA